MILETWNDLWTGDGTLSSPRGADSIIYDSQPIRDRPVGGVGISTLCGDVSILVIFVFVAGLSGLCMYVWILIVG